MTRRPIHLPAAWLLAALIPVALAAAMLLAGLHADPAAGRVYSVAAILDATSRDAAAWDGRVVRVRGVIQPGLVMVRFHSKLLTLAPGPSAYGFAPPRGLLAVLGPGYLPLADPASPQTELWVGYGRYDGPTAWLRRLPVVGNLMPGPRSLQPGEVITYRVHLHAGQAPCPSPGCLVGTLLDYATPALEPAAEFPGPSAPAAR